MTKTTHDIAGNTYELASSLNEANAKAQEDGCEMLDAIERAQERIAEMLRFAGVEVER